ncbi:putative Aminoglycoside phosphotransferase [Desulfamplus magnetovallimortis]|uniref:Putative Aminoglycoside phosphotransferase n=1 Tax=Desulfamplus magnetovallimortis TaxID=1246637 RepID=A0A1W1HHB1_9BACT|nr:aminoglycoside phosphotransferase family protein [Desulfamplus magnetovallimortis]SLM31891.1 putative Aminoglycoside phosphotransferase [Desulfamplus magnetovallimortis]
MTYNNMTVFKGIKNKINEITGEISNIVPIEKGFSSEKKWQITAKNGVFLLRSSPSNMYERKKEEYDLMLKLHNKGVRCNKPLAIFEAENFGTKSLYSFYSYLPGQDADSCINEISGSMQYEMGVKAGNDLKKINSIQINTKDFPQRQTRSWHQRKWEKHSLYCDKYKKIGYRFDEDKKIQRFIEMNYNAIEDNPEIDTFQHDDFHLGNIIVHNNEYGGVIDFNRYDWGDPLHEFVKLEWFTWPVSKDFAKGQVNGYFGTDKISEDDSLKIAVYIAMSIFSTVVWTIRFHPHTMGNIEKKINAILQHYSFFEKTVPDWSI